MKLTISAEGLGSINVDTADIGAGCATALNFIADGGEIASVTIKSVDARQMGGFELQSCDISVRYV